MNQGDDANCPLEEFPPELEWRELPDVSLTKDLLAGNKRDETLRAGASHLRDLALLARRAIRSGHVGIAAPVVSVEYVRCVAEALGIQLAGPVDPKTWSFLEISQAVVAAYTLRAPVMATNPADLTAFLTVCLDAMKPHLSAARFIHLAQAPSLPPTLARVDRRRH